jgi:sRNA-binding protein
VPIDRNQYVHHLYQQNVQILIDRFPIVFNRDNPLPLEVGAFESIIAVPDLGMGDEELECVLLCWTARREYCRSIVMMRQRFDLEGNPVERIDQETLAAQQERYDRFVRRGML